jgi:GcrA cell cycle regulator
MYWTDERVDLLRKLWTQGLSASQIAGELAGGVTRNAVIGKVHRLGLSGRAKAPGSVQTGRTRKPATRVANHPMAQSGGSVRGNLALAPKIMSAPSPMIAMAPLPESDVVVPMSERVTIMELREAMCRWPFGDPSQAEFRFCGAHSPVGTPYCTHHSRIAYQPSVDRRRVKITAM